MQCLFVADLHYSLPQFDWLLQAAKRYDLVVLAGDALPWPEQCRPLAVSAIPAFFNTSLSQVGSRVRKPASSTTGIAIGPGLEIPFLLVDQGVQHLAHHFQMVAMPRELALQVDEIGRRGVEAVCEQSRHQPRKVRVCSEEGSSILDDVDLRITQDAGCRGMRGAEQDGHFTDQRAWLIENCNLRLTTKHFDPTLRENIQASGVLALL